ncbi:Uncharacterised protein [Gordonia paraffinivorans]|uniref:Uncharacterized protein n=1 Tax=Gordonia paraffinivorans TaxID=175628 RepID=A0ABD7UXK1_9ACTN|nr:Uncharacterised protein [Gordonia paraffinivorans]
MPDREIHRSGPAGGRRDVENVAPRGDRFERLRIVRCVPTEFTAPDAIFAERLNPVASVVDHVPERGSRIGVDVDVPELPVPWADPVALDGTRLPD